MVRYTKAHKARSRAAIVDSAAALFRRDGYASVGIDALCNAAGLTRGTFYAHFKSKADLFHAVLASSHDLLKRLAQRNQQTPQALRKAGASIAQDYLDPRHRPQVLGGCSLTALGMDTVRADPAAQAAYAAAVTGVIEEFKRQNPDLSSDKAQAALALCVGGLLVGAACGDNAIGDRVAKAARKQVAEFLLDPPA